jgi:HK97 gp10 family phage protein
MHGLGNDFVVLDATRGPLDLNPSLIRELADRRFGIGCDQVLVVERPRDQTTDFHYRIFNADGSEVEQCGNGARCFARFVRNQGLTDKDEIAVGTAAGPIRLYCEPDGQVRVNMGAPVLEPARIPLLVQAQAREYQIQVASEIEADRAIRAQLGLSVEGSLDNPRPRTIRVKSPLRRTDPGNRWAGTYGSRPAPKWRERRLATARQHLAEYQSEMAARKAGAVPQRTTLDRRGAYEVKTALASSSRMNPRSARSLRWGHAYVGGRLRNSIHAVGPKDSGSHAEAWVIAGGEEAPYAKYQEFGTRHHAAQPFLRPAAAESRSEVVSRIAAAVGEAARTGSFQTDIEVVVRI